jgi:uncharacterized protein YodC (DUF2158 family)
MASKGDVAKLIGTDCLLTVERVQSVLVSCIWFDEDDNITSPKELPSVIFDFTTAPKKNSFKVGDSVQLTCGGPNMVISKVKRDDENFVVEITCWYMNKKHEMIEVDLNPNLVKAAIATP